MTSESFVSICLKSGVKNKNNSKYEINVRDEIDESCYQLYMTRGLSFNNSCLIAFLFHFTHYFLHNPAFLLYTYDISNIWMSMFCSKKKSLVNGFLR